MNKTDKEKELEEENRILREENKAMKAELKAINDLAEKELKRMEQEKLMEKFGYGYSDYEAIRKVLGEEITEEKLKNLKELKNR